MLNIQFIGSSTSEFFIRYGTSQLIGPISPVTGKQVSEGFSFEYPDRFLVESSGSYGENSVDHLDIEGNISVPLYDSGLRYPPPEENPWDPRACFLRSQDRKWYFSVGGLLPIGDTMIRIHTDGSPARFTRVTEDTVYWADVSISQNQSTKRWVVSASFSCMQHSSAASSRYRQKNIPGVSLRDLTEEEARSYASPKVFSLMNLSNDWLSWVSASRVYPDSNINGNLESIRVAIFREIDRLVTTNPRVDIKSPGALSQNAINSTLSLGVNMIEFLSEIRKPQSMLLNLKNWLSMRKNADRYLTVNYGILPTVSDLQEISSSIGRARQLNLEGLYSCYSSTTDSATVDGVARTYTRRLKIAYSPYESSIYSLVERLDSWGTLPTFGRLWDLIPYSFVVDWFIDVGKFLDSIDNRLRYSRLPLVYSLSSDKDIKTSSRQIDVGALRMSIDLTLTRYRRKYSEKVPLPEFTWDASGPSIKNYIDGAALITQRKAK